MILTKQTSSWQAKFVALLVIYVLVGICVSAIAPTSLTSTFWLSGGLAVGILSRWSLALIPAVLIGSLITNYFSGFPLAVNAVISSAHTLGVLAFFGIHSLRNIKSSEIAESKNTALFFFAALIAMLIPAISDAFVSPMFYEQVTTRWYLFFAMWISSAAGILLGSKLALEITVRNLASTAYELIDVWFLVFATIAIALIFTAWFEHTKYVFDFLCFLLLAFASLKFGSLLNRIIAVVLIMIAIYKCNSDAGIYSIMNGFDGNVYLLSFIGCIAILGFFIGNARENAQSIALEIERLTRDKELQELYLKAVVHSIPDLLLEIDKNNKCIAANGSSPVQSFAPDTLINTNLKNVLQGDSFKEWSKAIDDARTWNYSQGRVIEIIENKKTFSFELSITKKSTDNSENFSFICIARDITKRLASHQEDLANEKRFRDIFDAVENIAVQGYNRTHEVIYWNKASEKLYGYPENEALGEKLEELIVPHHIRHAVHTDIENWHLKDIKMPAGELTLRDKKGNTVFVYSNHIMIETHNGKEMFCLDIDISHQRRALARAAEELTHRQMVETSLRDSERRTKRAQVMGNIALWSWSPEDNSYSINEIALQFLNIPEHNLNGDMQYFINHYVVADDRSRFFEAFQNCVHSKSNLEIEVSVVIEKIRYQFLFKGQQIEKEGVMIIDGIIQATKMLPVGVR